MAGWVASPTRSADAGLELPAGTFASSHWSATQWTVLKSGDAARAAIGVAVQRRMAARVAVAQLASLLMFAFTLCLPLVCGPIGTGRSRIRAENKSHAALAHGHLADAAQSLCHDARRRYLPESPAVSHAGMRHMRQTEAGSPGTTH